MFYKAVVQTVLLYGLESWVITPAILKLLEGFHHRVARRLSNMGPRLVEEEWHYPPIEEALEASGLYTMLEYIERRQNTIAEYVATRPIYHACTGSTRHPGSSRRTMWWTQTFDDEMEDVAQPQQQD